MHAVQVRAGAAVGEVVGGEGRVALNPVGWESVVGARVEPGMQADTRMTNMNVKNACRFIGYRWRLG